MYGETKAAVTDDIWNLFVKMYIEVLKASFHQYPRYLTSKVDYSIRPLLLVFTDASQSTVVAAYIAYTSIEGKLVMHLVYAKGGLGSAGQTIPKKELQGVTNG